MAVPRLAVLLALLALLAWAVPAQAFRLSAPSAVKAGNPAHALERMPMDPSRYDPATGCSDKPKPGMAAFVGWLQQHAHGVLWGTFRCERWGHGRASLHAEGRAVDWHLNVYRATDRAAARRLIELLLAPDRTGEPHALARRMGVQEVIWDCSYWSAGMVQFIRYSPCYGKSGKPRKRVDRTLAHRDHIHFGLTKAGAWRKTSFWRAAAPRRR